MQLCRLKLSGLLSFGPRGVDLPLAPLNVLIGPNGSGKSNFLEAVALLQTVPTTISEPIARKGGLDEFLWKGPSADNSIDIEAIVEVPSNRALRHVLQLTGRAGRVMIADERVEPLDAQFRQGIGRSYRLSFKGDVREGTVEKSRSSYFTIDEFPEETIFSIFNRPDASLLSLAAPKEADLWHLRELYGNIHLYRDWAFGRDAILRTPCGAHGRSDFLNETADNLPLVLSQFYGEQKRVFLESMRNVYEGIVDFRCPVVGGTVGLFLEESGNRSIPATLLSDGTLRYLCLLAILLEPKPPPLICIEEPELGLHPDLLPTLCDLMVDASRRSQLIVTTHSDVLVDALTDQPESVVVCEKHDGQTEMRRLDKADLSKWLEDYGLGALWTSGELGGNRW